MNDSSTFGYNDALEENPFSDVISQNASGYSSSPPLVTSISTSSSSALPKTTTNATTAYSPIHSTTTIETTDNNVSKATETTISTGDSNDTLEDASDETALKEDSSRHTISSPTEHDNHNTSTTTTDTDTAAPSPSAADNSLPSASTDTDNILTTATESLALNDPSSSSAIQEQTGSPIREDSGEESDQQSEALRLPESGARPYFEISVEDPQKVGDAINAHIVYKVKTKTNSPAFRSSEFVVARRYRDFLWLYNQLTNGNPGVIVPPVPEKHALGRFQDEFVESRRIALERCLRKTVSHPMLYGDPDLKVFLESESFNIEKRQKRAEPETPKLGFMRSFGETISSAASNPFAKFIENDDWFASKKTQLDALETQLKILMKSVEAVVKQRKELGGAISDFGESMFPLASAELNRNLSTHLTVLGDIQKQLKELHEEQAQCDILSLEHTIDEYIRIIGSIKISFNARIRAYQTYQQAEAELQKKIALYEKLKGQQKIKSEKMAATQQEIEEMRQRVEELQKEFDDISKLIKNELDRFDQEKVEDFKESVEAFLCSMIEHQKKVIALWETYFEQTEGLDDDDDGDGDALELVQE
ncbi:Vps5 C terminal like-domain-containing protein [Halteromyces radiatus]|uniref:Vps5 C terminal like-domain-containing protein n=1 Tax=Halteromyces radiatus TaxID=101107 RepID=UPI00221EC3B3|nr:Vps5 C terminal like-domain-containing protein [Halteromyces radiatus]KAI8097036.1 Vps5 C terminal like-domain-containing protein [Halteromyces radiatus]